MFLLQTSKIPSNRALNHSQHRVLTVGTWFLLFAMVLETEEILKAAFAMREDFGFLISSLPLIHMLQQGSGGHSEGADEWILRSLALLVNPSLPNYTQRDTRHKTCI